MFKLFKFLKTLKEKGFATAEEKANIKLLMKELNEEEKEEVKEEVESVEALPEEDPSKTEDNEKVEEEIEKNIKTLVNSAVKSATKEQTEKAIEGIKSEVKNWIESQKEAIAKKAGAYNIDVQEKRHGVNEYLRKFVRATLEGDTSELLKINKLATTKELTTDSSGSPYGGYVVNRELSAEIRALITEYGIARQEFTTLQLSKNAYDANTLVTDVTVYWVDEGSQIGSTQVVIGQDELKLKKLGAIVTLTRELLEDEEIDLFSFIGSRVAEAFARKEDEAFFTGQGVSDMANAEYTGILYNASCNQLDLASGDAFTDLTADDLLNMQDSSPQSVAKNGKYYMHRSIRNLVRKLKNLDGTYIYQNPSESGPALIWGKPVVEVEVMPSIADSAPATPFIIYGDLKKSSIFGYKGSMSADRFNSGIVRNVVGNADINLITTDREAIRWIERVGAMTIMPTCATVLSTKSGS